MMRKTVSITFQILAATIVIAFISTAAAANELPKGWFKAGSHPQHYVMVVDSSIRHRGKAAARIESTDNATEDGFGTLMQTFKADAFRGKRVRLSAWMKTENASSAQMWLRLDGVKSTLGFDNMDNRPVKGTTDWKKYEITLEVPEAAVNIAFGFFVAGKGKAWADEFQFEVVGKDVASTNMMAAEEPFEAPPSARKTQEAPQRPLNLDFEDERVNA